jgi:pimeloyl-ACP methyl ester carboxylesterase
VDGAGGFQGTSKALVRELQATQQNLGVVSVDWTHGFARVFADQVDWRHARESGCKLAGEILAYRQTFPERKVYIVAHSAGSAVAIAAAEALPPGSIDRIVLLAPSIATDYDLRPALSGVRETIEVFYSSRDLFHLGFGITILGTADGCRGCTAAGRTGFQPQVLCPEDMALYAKLRQHPWDNCLAWTGNKGGHYGSYQPEFLRAFVLPLLAN